MAALAPLRAALLLLSLTAGACHAGAFGLCAGAPDRSAAQQDLMLRFGAVVKAELQATGRGVAVVARSGLDLGRFGVRYSHAGISLQASANAPWSVRQLYYACDERRPRIFDEGLAGFALGTDDPALGYVSAVLLPPGAAAAALQRTALDDAQALQLLGAGYSANAYAGADRYQNCNQWVAEMLAAAWSAGGAALRDADDGAGPAAASTAAERASAAGAAEVGNATGAAPDAAPRADSAGAVPVAQPAGARRRAQRWLALNSYVPTVFDAGSAGLAWLAGTLPYLHSDDHPADDLAHGRFRVSMPASIEAFVRSNVPGAERIEFCHTAHAVVVRHGWEPIADGCTAAAGDTVIDLD